METPPRSPSLSLCMIARNEERFLADCLASVRGVVDEVVLVDTGSTDGTVPIALRAGARVVAEAWRDDFSAARNAGIDVARGTHVLVLDADERLAPEAGAALRAALSAPEIALGALPLHNASRLDASPEEVLSGAARIGAPNWVPRFFPRDPVMRYRRRVHEHLTEGLEALAAAGRGSFVPIRAPIVHLGGIPSLRARLGRDERNERLLERAVAEDPSDGDLAGYLVADLVRMERFREARAAGERSAAPFFAALERGGREVVTTVRLGYALGLAQVETGDPEAGLATVRRSARWFVGGEHANLVFVEAYALERLRRLEEARERYTRCLELDGIDSSQPILTGVTNDLARLQLAEVCRALGRNAEALEHARRARGNWTLKGVLLEAEVCLESGDAAAADARLAELEAALPEGPRPPDLDALRHAATAALGRADEASLLRATEAPEERWITARRRRFIENAVQAGSAYRGASPAAPRRSL